MSNNFIFDNQNW